MSLDLSLTRSSDDEDDYSDYNDDDDEDNSSLGSNNLKRYCCKIINLINVVIVIGKLFVSMLKYLHCIVEYAELMMLL